MLYEGEDAICIDEDMGRIGPVLTKGRRYQVTSYIPPTDCKTEFPDHPSKWHENGGRVEVSGLPGCFWFGRRFNAIVKPNPMS
jgi:hypothetical protein